MLHHYSKSSGRGTQSYPQVSGVSGYKPHCQGVGKENEAAGAAQAGPLLPGCSFCHPFPLLGKKGSLEFRSHTLITWEPQASRATIWQVFP